MNRHPHTSSWLAAAALTASLWSGAWAQSPDHVWSRALGGYYPDIGRALAHQAAMFDRSRKFFERYSYFILPVTQVEPFDINTPYPTQISGTPMTTYIDWMRSCWYVSMMSNPAISVPGGFSSSGLPVGLQIVGRHRDEFSVLQLAYAFEQATRHGQRRPALLA